MEDLTLADKLNDVLGRIDKLEIDLSEEQLDFIVNPAAASSFLSACPGSGKTEVVGIKAAYEFVHWDERFMGIAVLSFTKNAAKEISQRIKKYTLNDNKHHPHFVGTIDSWLHSYIMHPFGHRAGGYEGKNQDKSFRIIDNKERYDFLIGYKTIINLKPYQDAWVNEYYYQCGSTPVLESQSRYLSCVGLSDEIKSAMIYRKNKFLKAGFATYADCEYICYNLLKDDPVLLQLIVKRFSVFYVDECQDLSYNQLQIFQQLFDAGAKIHFVGDSNQSIYEFKKVSIEKIREFIKLNKLLEMRLTKNFRSNQHIVNVSDGLRSSGKWDDGKQIIGLEKILFTECCLLWEYEEQDYKLLPQHFINKIEQINNSLEENSLKIKIDKSAVLARSHSSLSPLKNSRDGKLSKAELIASAINCWASSPRSGRDLQDALHQLGKALCQLAYKGEGNHQNQYCPQSYTNFEWRDLLYNLMTELNLNEHNIFPFGQINWANWVSSVKNVLERYWEKLKTPESDWESAKSKVRSPSGFAKMEVGEFFKSSQNSYSKKLRLTTFHDIKGETLDAALIISSDSKKSRGGHFEQWISGSINESEYVRFAYVASSRPKHLLIWAIPKGKNSSSISKIQKLGFIVKTFK
jgi:DNA helicase-2/ATP-dependent DNA helicase PcrA